MDAKQMEMQEKISRELCALLRLSLGKPAAAAGDKLTEETLDAVLKLAKRHEVQPMAAYGLLLSGRLTQEQEQKCRMLVYQMLLHQERMDQELRRTCALLEQAEIPYMPLKGAVVRGLYPEPWMRTSGDIDILVKDAQRAADLLEKNGYTRKETDAYEITLISPKGIVIELHFQLIEVDTRVNALLERVWEYAVPREGSCCYEMEPELFYYYHMAHMARHMIFGGCGIRFFVDIWLITEKIAMDAEKKQQMLCQGGLTSFTKQSEQLSRVWFGEEAPDPLTSELETFILNGGVFGSRSNIVKLRRGEAGSELRFLLRRVFPPHSEICLQSPVLKKYPVLLPAFWVRRLWRHLTQKGSRRSAMNEVSLNKTADSEEAAATRQLFRELELL